MLRSKAIEINGCDQWVYIRLAPKARKTLLFLHGGPGWADAPWAHFVCEKLWSHFNIVHWDQRGANRSPLTPETLSSLTIDQLLSDGLALVDYLKNDLLLNEVILVGHSWGSFFGFLLTEMKPDLFSGLVTLGQFVDIPESDEASLNYCKSRAEEIGRAGLMKSLSELPRDFYLDVDLLFKQREILEELSGSFASPFARDAYKSITEGAPVEYQVSWEILGSTSEMCARKLWCDLVKVSLKKHKVVKVPFLMMQGVHDHCTDTAIALKWFEDLEAPIGKLCVTFDRSGHWPQIEENEKFAYILTSWCAAF